MHRWKVFSLAPFVLLAACGGEAVNAPPSAAPPLPKNSGLVITPGARPACFANLSEMPPLAVSSGQVVKRNGAMTRPRLIAGSEQLPLPRAALPTPSAEVNIVARCILHKEGNVSDCNFVCAHPELEQLVLANLQARRYVPVTFEGVPVDVTYTFQFRVVGP